MHQELTSDVPRFSPAERDQRWRRVRALMREERLDAIFVPPNTGLFDQLQANVRYLTGIGGNCFPAAAVFPLDGEVTAITGPNVDVRFWRERQDWVDDIRLATVGWGYAGTAIERLRELDLGTARIGITGLAGNTRSPEGVTSFGIVDGLRRNFPDAEFVDATLVMERARFVKSDEELSFMRAADALVERALAVMHREAGPGVPENVVYARMLASMVEGGGEIPTMILWSAGRPQPPSNQHMPSRRVLRAGDMVCTEAEARWGGYIAQIAQPMFVGRAPEEYKRMFSLQQEALAACYESLRPGNTVGDIVDVAARFSTDDHECRLIMHARGLGDDSPMAVLGHTRNDLMRNWPIEENSTFIVKPMVRTRDRRKYIYWGDTVVTGRDGALRLGRRAPELMETNA
ncbi:M24 family metallopeptidase [Actinoallomurus soli]|uniref:M24 family metallopeptidase n=1 Tax=Actinoallomurus soli TaxID=2952535 RepID=UPI0020920F22|nr:M24 family metallopeptidase [Actinoallomurus soli]MCO5972632.1 M24 family metallopeptidase [Actinoallomurus soli]